MQFIKPIGFLAAVTVLIACFLPWVYIESPDITVTGLSAKGTTYGKPGLLHLVFTFVYLVLFAIPRVWSRRLNLLFTAFNFAWAVRNFLLITTCSGGECPVKKAGLYLILAGSAIMLIAVLVAPEREKA
jgi:hypothetical protein